MPLLELTHLRLRAQPADSPPVFNQATSCAETSGIPEAFIQAWTNGCVAASAGSRHSFRLYRSTNKEDEFWLIGGWNSSEQHSSFISSPHAKELAKAIEQWTNIIRISHVAADIESIGWSGLGIGGASHSSLLVREWKVETGGYEDGGIEKIWRSGSGVASGWDVSSDLQGQCEEFRVMLKVAGADGQGAFSVNGAGKEGRKERSRFALSVVGKSEARIELVVDGVREVRKEVLRYVLG